MQSVTFILAGEILAIPTSALREILEPVPVTRVPQSDGFATGLINVRGGVVPLADLRVPMRMARHPADEHTRMLVLEVPIHGETTVVAILADRVLDVCEIPDTQIDPVPEVGTRWPPELVRGIARLGDAFILLPDLPVIFSTGIGTGADAKKDLIA